MPEQDTTDASTAPAPEPRPGAAGPLSDRVAIVTGAANGIGRLTAERFVAAGARVGLIDVDPHGAEVAAALGGRACFVRTDIADADQARRSVATVIETFGALHILANVAGVSGGRRRFLDDDLRDFERVMAIDLFGLMAMCQAAARHMAAHGGGAIVNVSSGAGVTPGVGMQPYRAAKAGVAHLTRCLAVELGEHGIRVNCVAPANIATSINAAFDKAAVTSLQPLAHQGVPADVAGALVFLASDHAAHITGTVLPIDGGMAVGCPPRFPVHAGAATPDPRGAPT